jgi:plastocyanin
MRLLALGIGLVAALVVAGLPASASNKSIAAVSYTNWNPADVSIEAGDDVTWSNATGVSHNVCVAAAGASSGCAEYRSGDAASSWPSEGFTHRFASTGSFRYVCELHPGMTGTITVTAASTGTSTLPPPDTMPTDTITNPTEIEQNSVADDARAPSFVGKPKRRASRKSLIVELRSSEDGTLKATVLRRPPGGRSFSRISEASLHVKQGKNVATLPRKAGGRLRSGSYRVKLQLVDAAGNKSSTKTLSFKLA